MLKITSKIYLKNQRLANFNIFFTVFQPPYFLKMIIGMLFSEMVYSMLFISSRIVKNN